MCLRRSDRTKDGKTHTYSRLLRSVRQGGKVVQQTVAPLGELDAAGRAKARALARVIAGGAELLPEGRETVPWSWMAATLVIGRLCQPSSELYLAERWYPRTALEDLLGLPDEKVNDDRPYRALDRLLPYDVTSTYFEGMAEGNGLARRGHSRDHRRDGKQVCIALVVTREGMPSGYELFAGNRTDVTTVEEIVETMESRYDLARRICVMDRGMTSAEKIAWLKRTGRRYLIGTHRPPNRRDRLEDGRPVAHFHPTVRGRSKAPTWSCRWPTTRGETYAEMRKLG